MNDTLRNFASWLAESDRKAERWVADFLDLDGRELHEALERHQELQPGITRGLLWRVREASPRDPARAAEVAGVLAGQDGFHLPLHHASLAASLKMNTSLAHARALRDLGRFAEAHDAIGAAYDACRHLVFAAAQQSAMIGVVEAEVLHGLGDHAEALRVVRDAAASLRSWPGEDYAEATAVEARIHRDLGAPEAVAAVWRAALDHTFRKDLRDLAILSRHHGTFFLRCGDAKKAAICFENARLCSPPGTRARWGEAQAWFASGNWRKAIVHYRMVQRELLAQNQLIDAAIATTELLDVLLLSGRHESLSRAAETLVPTFAREGLPIHALRAWIFVRERARECVLTRQEVEQVRRYFERLELRPGAVFKGGN